MENLLLWGEFHFYMKSPSSKELGSYSKKIYERPNIVNFGRIYT